MNYFILKLITFILKVCHLVNLYICTHTHTHTHTLYETITTFNVIKISPAKAVCRPSSSLGHIPCLFPGSQLNCFLSLVVLEFSINGFYTVYSWLLSVIILRSIHVNECIIFFTASGITLNGFIFCLFTHLLVERWVVSSFWHLKIKLLCRCTL